MSSDPSRIPPSEYTPPTPAIGAAIKRGHMLLGQQEIPKEIEVLKYERKKLSPLGKAVDTLFYALGLRSMRGTIKEQEAASKMHKCEVEVLKFSGEKDIPEAEMPSVEEVTQEMTRLTESIQEHEAELKKQEALASFDPVHDNKAQEIEKKLQGYKGKLEALRAYRKEMNVNDKNKRQLLEGTRDKSLTSLSMDQKISHEIARLEKVIERMRKSRNIGTITSELGSEQLTSGQGDWIQGTQDLTNLELHLEFLKRASKNTVRETIKEIGTKRAEIRLQKTRKQQTALGRMALAVKSFFGVGRVAQLKQERHDLMRQAIREYGSLEVAKRNLTETQASIQFDGKVSEAVSRRREKKMETVEANTHKLQNNEVVSSSRPLELYKRLHEVREGQKRLTRALGSMLNPASASGAVTEGNREIVRRTLSPAQTMLLGLVLVDGPNRELVENPMRHMTKEQVHDYKTTQFAEIDRLIAQGFQELGENDPLKKRLANQQFDKISFAEMYEEELRLEKEISDQRGMSLSGDLNNLQRGRALGDPHTIDIQFCAEVVAEVPAIPLQVKQVPAVSQVVHENYNNYGLHFDAPNGVRYSKELGGEPGAESIHIFRYTDSQGEEKEFKCTSPQAVIQVDSGEPQALSELQDGQVIGGNGKQIQLHWDSNNINYCDHVVAPTEMSGNVVVTLADGSGVKPGAKEAAQQASQVAQRHVEAVLKSKSALTTQDVARAMIGGVQAAQKAIIEEGHGREVAGQADHGALTGQATFTQASIVTGADGNKYLVAVAVGDAPLYVRRKDGEVQHLTEGQRGDILDSSDPGGQLGGDGIDLRNLSVYMVKVEPGDLVLICSDGVGDNLDPEKANRTPKEVADDLELKDARDEWTNSPEHRKLKTAFAARQLDALAEQSPAEEGGVNLQNFNEKLTAHIAKSAEGFNYAGLGVPGYDKDSRRGKPDHASFCTLLVA